MCLFPKLIRNRKYTANKKNGGYIPPVSDERTLLVPVGCGKCMECMRQKAREWQIRMLEEIKSNKNGKFITLTFNEQSLSELTKIVLDRIEDRLGDDRKEVQRIIENDVATLATRRFLERWRKEYKKSVRHWLVTELGHQNTRRIHMHGILWTDETSETIEKVWKYGKIWVGDYVNEKTVNYIIKYVNKMDAVNKGYKPKILCSAGLGKNYLKSYNARLNKYDEENTKDEYTYSNGKKAGLPIYYRNKIYSEEQREKLWLKMLDKEERWVGGEKIDISKNENDYYETLKHYRIINKKLGYGDDSKMWSAYEYNRNRKKLKKKLKKE